MKEIISNLKINFDLNELSSIETELPFWDLEEEDYQIERIITSEDSNERIITSEDSNERINTFEDSNERIIPPEDSNERINTFEDSNDQIETEIVPFSKPQSFSLDKRSKTINMEMEMEMEFEDDENYPINISDDSDKRTGTVLSFNNKKTKLETEDTNPNILFRCQFCEKGFTVSIALSRHVQKHFAKLDPAASTRSSSAIDPEQNDEMTEDETTSHSSLVKCNDCEKTFLNISEVENHSPCHYPEREPVKTEKNSKENEKRKDVSGKTNDERQQQSCDFCDELFCGKNIEEHMAGCAKNPQMESPGNSKVTGKKDSVKKGNQNCKKFDCIICGAKLTLRTNLIRHIVSIHYSKKLEKMFGPFNSSCSICNKTFQSKTSWLTHLLKIHKILPISREEVKRKETDDMNGSNGDSNEESNEESNIESNNEPINEETSDENNSEKENNETFEEKRGNEKSQDFRIGRQPANRRNNIENESSKCLACGLVCGSSKILERHLSNVHYGPMLESKFGPFNSACHLCAVRLSSKQSWMHHLVSVHKVIPFRDVEKTPKVKIEVQGDEGGEELEVDSDKVTASRTNQSKLVLHDEDEKRTRKEKPENRVSKNQIKQRPPGHCKTCFKCQTSFPAKQKLMRHLAIVHYKEKLIQKFGHFNSFCSLCDLRFATSQSWTAHLLSVHKAFPTQRSDDEERDNKRFSRIPLKSISKKNRKSKKSRKLGIKIKREESKSSEGETEYFCPKCPRSSTNYANLLSHMSLLHFKDILRPGLKPNLACGTCDKPFAFEFNAIVHLASCHNALEGHVPDMESLKQKHQ